MNKIRKRRIARHRKARRVAFVKSVSQKRFIKKKSRAAKPSQKLVTL